MLEATTVSRMLQETSSVDENDTLAQLQHPIYLPALHHALVSGRKGAPEGELSGYAAAAGLLALGLMLTEWGLRMIQRTQAEERLEALRLQGAQTEFDLTHGGESELDLMGHGEAYAP